MPVGGNYPYPIEEITQKRWQNNLDADRVIFVDAEGNIIGPNNPLPTTTTVTISGDLEIGAVELKDGSTNNRAIIDSSGNLYVKDSSLDVNLSTIARENTLSSIDTKLTPGSVIGDVNSIQKGNWSVTSNVGSGTREVCGSLIVTQQNGNNLHTIIDSGSISITNTNVSSGSLSTAVKFVDQNNNNRTLLFNADAPQICSQTYLQALAEGDVSGHTPWYKIGFTPTMTTSESDLWSKAGTYTFPVSGIQMAAVSDSALDTSLGSGARQVIIYYLDNNFLEKTEIVSLSGLTPVNTIATNIYRINGFRVYSAGTNAKPFGNLSLTSTDTLTTYSYILAGFNRARSSFYTVPANKMLYIVTVNFSYGYSTNQTHYCRLYTRATQNEGIRTPGLFYPFTETICSNSAEVVSLEIPTRINEKVDIKVSGISTYSGIAMVALRGWLE